MTLTCLVLVFSGVCTGKRNVISWKSKLLTMDDMLCDELNDLTKGCTLSDVETRQNHLSILKPRVTNTIIDDLFYGYEFHLYKFEMEVGQEFYAELLVAGATHVVMEINYFNKEYVATQEAQSESALVSESRVSRRGLDDIVNTGNQPDHTLVRRSSHNTTTTNIPTTTNTTTTTDTTTTTTPAPTTTTTIPPYERLHTFSSAQQIPKKVADPETGILFVSYGTLNFIVNDTYFPHGMVGNILIVSSNSTDKSDRRYQLRVGKGEQFITGLLGKDPEQFFFWNWLMLEQQAFWGERSYGWILGGVAYVALLAPLLACLLKNKNDKWSKTFRFFPNLILAGITLASAVDYLAHLYNPLGFQEALTDSQKGRCAAYIIYYISLSMLFFPILPFLVNWFENKQNNRCANITNFIVFLVIFLFTLFVIPVPSYFVFQAFLFIAVIWYGVWGCKKHHQNESAEQGKYLFSSNQPRSLTKFFRNNIKNNNKTNNNNYPFYPTNDLNIKFSNVKTSYPNKEKDDTLSNTNDDVDPRNSKDFTPMFLTNRRVPSNTSGVFYVNQKDIGTERKSSLSNVMRYSISH